MSSCSTSSTTPTPSATPSPTTTARRSILAGETDPDKLHDLQADLDAAQVYSPEQIDDFVERYLDGAERDQLDPILDACVAVYRNNLDEDGQVDFKGKAKAFVRTYGFLSCVLPYTYAPWEKRSIFLNFLIWALLVHERAYEPNFTRQAA